MAQPEPDEESVESQSGHRNESDNRKIERHSSPQDLNDKRDRHRHRQRRRRRHDDESDDHRRRSRSRRKRRKKHERSKKSRKRRSRSSSSSSSGSCSSSSSSSSSSAREPKKKTKKVLNSRLLSKLAARGETLEEREERRGRHRATLLSSKFGYTSENNPFNDPNLHDTFSWKKKEAAEESKGSGAKVSRKDRQGKIFDEIEKVRQRRHNREIEMLDREKQRAEESRRKELENYDEWARKEEEFHLAQHRQRSAIRLVEGRERPIDVLAKNLLLFGLTEQEKVNRSRVKYQEKYNALDRLGDLEVELQEPHDLVEKLTLEELRELEEDVLSFLRMEKDVGTSNDTILLYWESLGIVIKHEIERLIENPNPDPNPNTGNDVIQNPNPDPNPNTGNDVIKDIQMMFEGKSKESLDVMRNDIINDKLRPTANNMVVVDTEYWQNVLRQLNVYRAKAQLSDIHSKMLVRQLETLEKKKEALTAKAITEQADDNDSDNDALQHRANDSHKSIAEHSHQTTKTLPTEAHPDLGNLEEELGLTSEILTPATYKWSDKYRPRKPRYFNRVKTGYDWNKYNQTHYDPDNPPPKIVQGYKFNIFYPDLIDKSRTPTYMLEPADTDDFCIIRFTAGPPYEDVAFKIINREWNKSRKRGFRSTFERGVLSVYFNFHTHWYRR